MKKTETKTTGRTIIVGLVALLLIIFVLSGSGSFKGPHTEYKCDVKNLRLSTTIKIEKENEDFAKVKGNIFKFVTDPLTMFDMQENKIAYAGDAYHFIAQDSHTIFVENELRIEMVGLVDLFGESYDIYNANQEKIAKVKFNMLNTKGKMYDTEKNLIADYRSKLLFNDFKVRIAENCSLDEKTLLMMFSSYYSDQHADRK